MPLPVAVPVRAATLLASVIIAPKQTHLARVESHVLTHMIAVAALTMMVVLMYLDLRGFETLVLRLGGPAPHPAVGRVLLVFLWIVLLLTDKCIQATNKEKKFYINFQVWTFFSLAITMAQYTYTSEYSRINYFVAVIWSFLLIFAVYRVSFWFALVYFPLWLAAIFYLPEFNASA
jgi:hypothetical protein